MGGGGGKGGKGGGGGGSISVTVDSNSVVDSDNTMNSTLNSTSNSNNQIDSTSTAQLQIVGLDNINVKTESDSDSKNDVRLAITEPIRTDSKNMVDIKPLQADLCLKLGIERLPFTKVCKPTERHFAISLFGTEVLGFDFSEERVTIIEDRKQPFVVQGPAVKRKRHGHHHGHHHDGGHTASSSDGGLHIKLGEGE